MIAKLRNERISEEYTSYDLFFYRDVNGELEQASLSIGGMIFENPFTQQDAVDKITPIFEVLYPGQTLDEIIFE